MTKKRPLARIDVPNIVMHLREYETDELQEFFVLYRNCVEKLRDRSRDLRLRRDIRRKARNKLKHARRTYNRLRATLIARNASLEPAPDEWEQGDGPEGPEMETGQKDGEHEL